MNKEKYLQIRNNNTIDFELLYDYYTIHCDKPLIKTLKEFKEAFSLFIQLFQINIDKIFEYYDNKFNVTKIIDVKLNKIIRYE
jgi:hypothetical protein